MDAKANSHNEENDEVVGGGEPRGVEILVSLVEGGDGEDAADYPERKFFVAGINEVSFQRFVYLTFVDFDTFFGNLFGFGEGAVDDIFYHAKMINY